MYNRYEGLIFDMDGTILDTEPTHRKAWHQVLTKYNVESMVALNGSPTWRIAKFVIDSNHVEMVPHLLAAEKTAAVQEMLLDTVRPLPLIDVVKLPWSTADGCRNRAVNTGWRILC